MLGKAVLALSLVAGSCASKPRARRSRNPANPSLCPVLKAGGALAGWVCNWPSLACEALKISTPPFGLR
jgi:hypothetical protein